MVFILEKLGGCSHTPMATLSLPQSGTSTCGCPYRKGLGWFGGYFFFLRHLYNTATLNPIHLKSIFPQSTSTALFISHTPERTKIIHISLWAGVNLQTDPAAHTKTRAILIPNSTFNWGRLTSPAQNRFLTFTQEAVHKSPFNSTSHLLETLTKKKKRNPRLISVMW